MFCVLFEGPKWPFVGKFDTFVNKMKAFFGLLIGKVIPQKVESLVLKGHSLHTALMRSLLILILGLLPIAAPAIEIAASITCYPETSYNLLRKLAISSSPLLSQANSVSLFFLAKTGGGLNLLLIVSTPDPASFIRKAQADILLAKYSYTITGNWIIGRTDGPEISAFDLGEMLKCIPPASTHTIAHIQPLTLVRALKSQAGFTSPEYEPLIEELANLDSLDVEVDTSDGKTAHITATATAHNGSPLGTFLSQRIPQNLSPAYRYMDIQNSPAYGYLLFNPKAVQIYLSTLRLHGVSLPILNGLAKAPLAASDGQAAFWWDSSGALFQLSTGRWATDQAESLLKIISTEFGDPPVDTSYTFTMGESPVWVTRKDGHPIGCTSLYRGNLIWAQSREKIYEIYEQWQTHRIPQRSLLDALESYGGIASQWVIKPHALLSSFHNQSNFFDTLGLFFDDTPVYLSLAIGNCSATVKAEIPWKLLNTLCILIFYPQSVSNF